MKLAGAEAPDGTRACIDPTAIAHNLSWLRRHLALADDRVRPRFWAVVKADAYGHSLEQSLSGLNGADGLAIMTLSDAYRCRLMGWLKPILVMSTRFSAADLNDPVLGPLHLTIDDARQLGELERLNGANAPFIWLRFAGSLHHAGFQEDDYRTAWQRLEVLAGTGRVAGIGHLQHYGHAENPERLAAEQRQFNELVRGMPGPVCTENSAALLVDPHHAARTDWIRVGIALYGISPLADRDGPALGLKPAMVLEAPVYGIQHVRAGHTLGYGSAFQASHDTRIGLVRCGYADGYQRNVGSDCAVLVGGRKSRIIGKVSMDTLTVDLSAHPDIKPNDMVTLWGRSELPVEAVARCAQTIAAQLCTGLTARVPRLGFRLD